MPSATLAPKTPVRGVVITPAPVLQWGGENQHRGHETASAEANTDEETFRGGRHIITAYLLKL